MSLEVGEVIGNRDVETPSRWTLKDDRSGRTNTYDVEPTEDDLKCFNRSCGYSSSKVISKDDESKVIVVRPVDKSGN